jgi:predicted dehydrogenase
MSKIKIGIVGLGWAASGHIPAFAANPDCEVVAVCTTKDQTAACGMVGHDVACYTDYNEFLKHPDLQVVDICTPHHLHAPQAIAAANAGKDLMIEKPMATTYEELVATRDAIHKNNVKSTVYFELRFIPQYQLVKSIIAQGLIGKVHHLEVDYYHGIGPWYMQHAWNVKKEVGVSALVTAGCHALDGLLFFKDCDVEEVSGFSTKSAAEWAKDYEYDSTSVGILKFADGTIGKCTSCVDCRQPYVFNVNLVGSEGSFLNNQLSTTQLAGVSKEEWIEVPSAGATSGDVLDHPYGPQVDEFMAALKAGNDSVVNFDSAFKTFRVVFAIDKAIAEGRTVKLSEFPA